MNEGHESCAKDHFNAAKILPCRRNRVGLRLLAAFADGIDGALGHLRALGTIGRRLSFEPPSTNHRAMENDARSAKRACWRRR